MPAVELTAEQISSEPECAICNEDFEVGECVLELGCRHHYHRHCALDWLARQSSCPVCRWQLPSDLAACRAAHCLPAAPTSARVGRADSSPAVLPSAPSSARARMASPEQTARREVSSGGGSSSSPSSSRQFTATSYTGASLRSVPSSSRHGGERSRGGSSAWGAGGNEGGGGECGRSGGRGGGSIGGLIASRRSSSSSSASSRSNSLSRASLGGLTLRCVRPSLTSPPPPQPASTSETATLP